MSWVDWAQFAYDKYKWLFIDPEPPPVPAHEAPRPRAILGVGKPPPPPPELPEAPLSPRRLLMILEAALLLAALLAGIVAWRGLLGDWPTRGNLAPPGYLRFASPVMLDAAEDRIWVATSGDLYRVDLTRGQEVLRKYTSRLPSAVVTCMQRAGGKTWLGTTRGLAYHAAGRVRRLQRRDPLAKAHVTCMTLDRRSRLWVGTAEMGLFIRYPDRWEKIGEDFPSEFVTALVPWGSGSVLAALYSGDVYSLNGKSARRVAVPRSVSQKAISRFVALSPSRAAAISGGRLFLADGKKWGEIDLEPLGEAKDVAAIDSRRAAVLGADGAMGLLDASTGALSRMDAGGKVSAVGAAGGKLVFAREGGVYIDAAQGRLPLSDWGAFMDVDHFNPAPADIPQDWTSPRFREKADSLAILCFLLGSALVVRGARWRKTRGSHGWRVQPLRQAAVGCAALGALFFLQSTGWVDTRINSLLWLPIAILAASWGILYISRVIRFEWGTAQDSFWLGIVLALSSLGAWLWWGLGSLMPSLLVCAGAGLLMGRALRGLRQGHWHGVKFVFGLAIWLFQLAALLPPLLFAGMTWGRAAFNMGSTAPIVQNLPRMPERLVISDDGLRLAYVSPRGTENVMTLVDGRIPGWNVKEYPVPSGEITPRFSPDGKWIAFCHPRENETLVEIVDSSAKRLWLMRVDGRPAPGWQPWWVNFGNDLLLVTISGERSYLWLLERVKQPRLKIDALRLATIPGRVTWPWLAREQDSLVCATDAPGLVRIFPDSGIVKEIRPRLSRLEPVLVYAPSEAGEAVLSFIRDLRDSLRHSYEAAKSVVRVVLDRMGWHSAPRQADKPGPLRQEKRDGPVFSWSDYELVREVMEARSGKAIACIARHRDGKDHLLHMGVNGEDVTVLYESQGNLFDLRWTGYKSRLILIEERRSQLSPLPVRKLLMVRGLPKEPKVRVTVPFTHWLGSPQFSPDGLRMLYAGPDQFWRVSMHPSSTFSIYEVLLESVRRGLNPPTGAVPVETQH